MAEEKCFLYDECNHCDCDGFCLRKYKLDSLYDNALISKTQRARITLHTDRSADSNAEPVDFTEFKQLNAISKDIINFIQTGQNLYLYSKNCGNGKTSWALRLAQSYLNEIWYEKSTDDTPVLFVSVPRYLLAIKSNISTRSDYVSHINKTILGADLVIWDDIAAKCGTEYEITNLLSIIDTRISMGKSNVYTSNLCPNEMAAALGERLASRVCNCSVNVQLKGADKRRFTVTYNVQE